MRTLALILVLLLVGAAGAQLSVDHGASVGIPVVLKLRLDGASTVRRVERSLVVQIDEGSPTVIAGGSLQILANVPWQLGVAYYPASAADAVARLRLHGPDGWLPLSSSARIIAHGGPTGGWLDHPMAIALDGAPPPDGRYRGALVYTLSQP
jgi:hypothetical protein